MSSEAYLGRSRAGCGQRAVLKPARPGVVGGPPGVVGGPPVAVADLPIAVAGLPVAAMDLPVAVAGLPVASATFSFWKAGTASRRHAE
jgi:hypothetical protein